MKPTHTLPRLTANYRGTEDGIATTVWLPNIFRLTGTLRAETTNIINDENNPMGWVRSVEDFTQTGLRNLLGYLGIQAETTGQEGRLTFPRRQDIAKRVARLNILLPDKHSLPTVRVWDGQLAATDYLEALQDDTLLLPTRQKTAQDSKAPLATVVAVAHYLPSWLALDPFSRELLADQAASVLNLPAELDEHTGETNADRLMAAILHNIAPPQLGAGRFTRTGDMVEQTGSADALYEISNNAPGGAYLSRVECQRLGETSMAHVVYLGKNVLASHSEAFL
jgi:hypothetical protein